MRRQSSQPAMCSGSSVTSIRSRCAQFTATNTTPPKVQTIRVPCMSTSSEARDGPFPPLLLSLTAVTGLVDAASYLKLGHVFVANMTGNVVFLGFAIAGAGRLSVGASLFAIAAFLAGSVAGGLLVLDGPSPGARWPPATSMQAVAVAVAAGLAAASASIPTGRPATGSWSCSHSRWASRTRWPAVRRARPHDAVLALPLTGIGPTRALRRTGSKAGAAWRPWQRCSPAHWRAACSRCTSRSPHRWPRPRWCSGSSPCSPATSAGPMRPGRPSPEVRDEPGRLAGVRPGRLAEPRLKHGLLDRDPAPRPNSGTTTRTSRLAQLASRRPKPACTSRLPMYAGWGMAAYGRLRTTTLIAATWTSRRKNRPSVAIAQARSPRPARRRPRQGSSAPTGSPGMPALAAADGPPTRPPVPPPRCPRSSTSCCGLRFGAHPSAAA